MLTTSASKTTVLTVLSLLCFAGNSILCRSALGSRLISPELFTAIRIGSGAVTLAALATWLRGSRTLTGSRASPASLAIFAYAILFSWAYVRIDAGIGALALFGMVQVTMIGWSISKKQSPTRLEWAGLAIAMCGLGLLTIPGRGRPDGVGLLLMIAAGIAWATYTLLGTRNDEPLGATARNFVWATPLAVVLPWLPRGAGNAATPAGIWLAVCSGVVTSGMGYSLWYAAVPKLGAKRAGIVQLAVPVIALFGAGLLLGEPLSPRTAASAVLILGGIGLSLIRR